MRRFMRTITALAAASIVLGAAALAAPDAAMAQPVAGILAGAVASNTIAQPVQDFSAQQRRPRTYTPRTYTPRYTPPRSNTAPRYIYPGSRDALDTCAFC
jgi:hypothetical protein